MNLSPERAATPCLAAVEKQKWLLRERTRQAPACNTPKNSRWTYPIYSQDRDSRLAKEGRNIIRLQAMPAIGYTDCESDKHTSPERRGTTMGKQGKPRGARRYLKCQTR